MRVLFVSTRSPWPLVGGHPLRTFHTLREIARRHGGEASYEEPATFVIDLPE